ncbi:MAG: DUF523 domain-containing protein [Desulfobacterales bacterium]|nr:DUF523 domain-containing protein [Desulfobacterales bacterium]MCP4159755.1 DUF523 domain-containing protein [Deltaproteobacteria bacterium]
MKKILVSSCLLSEKVRYNGKIIYLEIPLLRLWKERDIIVPFCPEVEAGLPVPRPPCEICGGNGKDVLQSKARVIDKNGDDLTDQFIKGAEMAVKVIKDQDVVAAVLKNGSPSCGSSYIYDGTFEDRKIRGKGVTTTMLEQNNIKVFNENETFFAQKFILTIR